MNTIPKVEHERPPSALFKFRRFPSLLGLDDGLLKKAESEREHFYDMVCNGHVRLSLPRSFSDHFDCRAYPIDAFDDPEEQKKAVFAGLEKFLRETKQDRGERFLANPKNSEFLLKHWLSFAARAFMQMREEIGVYSMCMVADRPAMWAMYADAGRGVCVQLDATLPPFDLSQRVIYQEGMPRYPMPIQLDNPLHRNFILQQMFQVKNIDWQHEREYRFVSAYAEGQDRILGQHGCRIDGLDLFFSPERVLAIGIGPAMDEQTINELKDGLTSRHCRVPLFRSEMSEREHKVLFKGLL